MSIILEELREVETDFNCFPITLNFNIPHYHSNLEIHYALGDNFEILLNGDKYKLKKGELILVNSLDIHSTQGSGTICVLIPRKYLEDIYEYQKEHPLTQNVFTDKDGKLLKIIRKFEDLSLHIFGKKAIMYELFCELYNMEKNTNNKTSPSVNPSYKKIVERFIEYVKLNYQNKLTIEKTAKTLNYSISHLSHSIKKYLNCNFNTYVNIVRLNVFIETIKRDPYVSKTSAILNCGFDSIQTFYRNFKQILKCTPTEFFKKLSIPED